MAINKWKKEDSNTFPSFSSFFDDFFGKNAGITVPAVNVKEDNNQFNIEVAAPGMKKEDFNIEVHRNIITISSENKMENKEEDKEGNYTRREYSYQSFSRSFSFPESVDPENVSASYKDGVLDIILPKKEEAMMKKKQIEVQ